MIQRLWIVGAGLFAGLGVYSQIQLLNLGLWYDESATVVGAKSLATGKTLYLDLFSHHGPLKFVPGMVTELFVDGSLISHRVPILLLQWACLALVFFSPLLPKNKSRWVYLFALSAIILIIFPAFRSNMYLYQNLAGMVSLVILSQYTLVSLAKPEALSASRVFGGNVLIACLPFLAASYGPWSAALFLASLSRNILFKALQGGCLGISLNLGWLAAIGSIPGFVVYHIYFNLAVYSQFQSSSINLVWNPLEKLDLFFVVEPWLPISFFSSLAALTYSAQRFEGFPWRSTLLFGGLLSLMLRWSWGGYYLLPFYYSALAFPLVSWQPLWPYLVRLRPLPYALGAVFIWVCFWLTPGKPFEDGPQTPTKSNFASLAQKLTDHDDSIGVFPILNHQYLLAKRAPVSGHIHYLPWQARYNEAPLWGYKIDVCEEIKQQRPKLLFIDAGLVWDQFRFFDYAPCIKRLIRQHYLKVKEYPLYISKEIWTDDLESAINTPPWELTTSLSLNTVDSLPLEFTQQYRKDSLIQLGIAVKALSPESSFSFTLKLKDQNGTWKNHKVSRSKPPLDHYVMVDVVPSVYQKAVLVSQDPIEIFRSAHHHCLIFFYEEGSKLFSKNCSLIFDGSLSAIPK